MLRIATRRSALAREQASQTGRLLAERAGEAFELVPMATTGDLHPDRAVAHFDSKGLFVDRTRQAVLDAEADLVVHSGKDLPSQPAPGLRLAAVPTRADPRDALITVDGRGLADLADGAVVGTSSERRKLQVQLACPRVNVVPVRGNLDTRLRKVADGRLDGVVVAAAGLQRLFGHSDQAAGALPAGVRAKMLEPEVCLPAPAQGALAVECRDDDEAVLAACGLIDDPTDRQRVRAERALLERLDAGCLSAVGALCVLTDEAGLRLQGAWGDPGGGRLVRRSLTGAFDDPAGLGRALADELAGALPVSDGDAAGPP